MNNYKINAIVTGILFLTATIAGILSAIFLVPILDKTDYLTEIQEKENQMIIGSLLVFIMSLAIANITVAMYPVLKKQNEFLATSSVVLRIIESTILMLSVICSFSLLKLSEEFVDSNASIDSYYYTIAELLVQVQETALYAIPFSLGAGIYYLIFYQSKLIPRWLSGWGFIGAILTFIDTWFILFGVYEWSASISILLKAPIALNELVLAFWLIFKGFDSDAITSLD